MTLTKSSWGTTMTQSDYPLIEVPKDKRRGLLPMAVILLGFTFFTATMWAGGTLGTAFSFSELLLVILVGNLLLGIYASALAFIAYKSGLNSVLMGRFCFGEIGSKLGNMRISPSHETISFLVFEPQPCHTNSLLPTASSTTNAVKHVRKFSFLA